MMRAIADKESERLSNARVVAIWYVIVGIGDLDEAFWWQHAVEIYSTSAATIA